MGNTVFTVTSGARTISSGNDQDFATNGAAVMTFEVITVTSTPVITAQAAFISTNYRNVESMLLDGTSVLTFIPPGTNTAALAVQDILHVFCQGASSVRLKYQSGTSVVVKSIGYTVDAITPMLLAKLIRSGLVVDLGSNNDVTVTPPVVKPYSAISDASDEDLISSSARLFYGFQASSIDATPVYIKFYDKATTPSESDTPIYRYGLPANSTAALGAATNIVFKEPIELANGLGVRIMTGIVDGDDNKVSANEVLLNVQYGPA